MAFYELGNALWRECLLLKKISRGETEKLLETIYPIVGGMAVSQIDDEVKASAVLALACKFNLTFYDAAYLSEALKTKRILVTDDRRLAKAAQDTGIKTLTSNAFQQA